MIPVYILIMLAFLFFSSNTALHRNFCNGRCARCEDGKCRECLYGWYGHNCNSECQNCWTSGCHKHSGICVQCQPGRYTKNCETFCPGNCKPDRKGAISCRRVEGNCLDGCKGGWWGDTCNSRCSEYCESGTCLQKNGHCIGDCNIGWWGPSCSKKCSRGCLNDNCSWSSGRCIDGCNTSWYGRDCRCSMKCMENICDRHGVCKRGCTGGYRGSTCNETCASNCLTCDQESDICTECKPGWAGAQCKQQSITTPSNEGEPPITEKSINGGIGLVHQHEGLLFITPLICFLALLELDTGC